MYQWQEVGLAFTRFQVQSPSPLPKVKLGDVEIILVLVPKFSCLGVTVRIVHFVLWTGSLTRT